MTIGRITNGIDPSSGDRFILFYGNTNDEFCDDDLVFGNIERILWRYFREQGYRRVVFFDGSEKIYTCTNRACRKTVVALFACT